MRRRRRKDGFHITEKNEMLLSSDTSTGISKSIGLGIIGFSEIYARLLPDIIVVLGDRYEILAAVIAAMIQKIQVAHIHGGELTQGSMDDSIRHSITKMSMLHFTSTEEYRRRVIQLGEEPERVYNVGALGVENIKNQKLLDKDELEQSIQFSLNMPYVVVTFHPTTLEDNIARQQFENLVAALDKFEEYYVLFTKSNADIDGRIINFLIDKYVNAHKNRAIAITSLGMIRYLSALKYCEMVIGNSSSGILEAPSLKIPTVNIGNRQLGRIRAKSVIDCGNDMGDIVRAISKAKFMRMQGDLTNIRNPYEGENTSEKIFSVIKSHMKQKYNINKHFYDISF